MLLHLRPSQLQGRRGNRRQRRQGQPLNHNYNKVSACRIRTCGGPTQSGLINLQRPRFFFLPFFPFFPPARSAGVTSSLTDVPSAPSHISQSASGREGKGNFMAAGFLVLRKKRNKNKRSDLAKKKKGRQAKKSGYRCQSRV